MAGSTTGAYHAKLTNGYTVWNTTNLVSVDASGKVMKDKRSIRHVEFGEDGNWIIPYDDNGATFSGGIPIKLYNKFKSRNPRLPSVSEVALGLNETWFVSWKDGKTEWSLPTNVSDSINKGKNVTAASLYSNENYCIHNTIQTYILGITGPSFSFHCIFYHVTSFTTFTW
mmetsp:Transcript_59750/g.71799  ORF Transcript_59750/g.71799 Transcript_59750/m.71799 type:complete len:170 (+) Transcript_59750:837-1346(+)